MTWEYAMLPKRVRIAIATPITLSVLLFGGARAVSAPLEVFNLRFEAGTNVGFSIEGKAEQIDQMEVDIDLEKQIVRSLRIAIDPAALDTGMATRNRHMLERVFTNAEGKLTPIVVSGANVPLHLAPTGHLEGLFHLSFHGESREIKVAIEIISPQRAKAWATIDISQFGVQPISLMGVRVANEVKVVVDEIRIDPNEI